MAGYDMTKMTVERAIQNFEREAEDCMSMAKEFPDSADFWEKQANEYVRKAEWMKKYNRIPKDPSEWAE